MRQPNAHQRARNTNLTNTAAARGEAATGGATAMNSNVFSHMSDDERLQMAINEATTI